MGTSIAVPTKGSTGEINESILFPVMNTRFLRSECKLPPAQLNHIDCTLSFWEDRVDTEETLTLTAREPISTLTLDAKALDILSVTPADYTYDREHNRLVIELGRKVLPGESFRVSVRSVTHPSDTILEGIYRDVTPPGDHPQQYMSQCQQWGFQRIMPVIDDCTAKCTFRTTLEGDSRYTHLISNGDVDRTTNPDGIPVPKPGDPSRKVITYVNKVPMAPYLFIACAGTWETLRDEVVYPEGKRIQLEYLVPPGRVEGARLPMQILKDSVLWQHRAIGFSYPFDTYRTISMQKSNFGGMENVGNTTIIAEAAMIDEMTSDSRLIYSYGVIPHEYEHSHCGSGVTMATPFDMWLNEAYTVTVEQDYVATVFDPTFLRIRDMNAIRSPAGGPLAEEDTGKFGQIVREGFNDPDEVVDGVTYSKAPEILRMLSRILTPSIYRRVTDLYFARFDGGNATTEQFLDCIREVAGDRLDVSRFADTWLFHAGYPCVSASYEWRDGKVQLHLSQRPNVPSARAPFILPFAVAAVDENGRDLFDTTVVFEAETADFTFDSPTRPAFLSLNRNASFYGALEDLSVTPEQLAFQARMDPNHFNRVEAMQRLTDIIRKNPEMRELLMQTYEAIFRDDSLPDGVKGFLLSVSEQPLDRSLLPNVRENVAFKLSMRKQFAERIGFEAITDALVRFRAGTDTLPVSDAIQRRTLLCSLLWLLSSLDTPEAWRVLEEHGAQAQNITDRLNTLAAIWHSSAPQAEGILAAAREELKGSLNGYTGYLSILGSAPRPSVFEAAATEEASPDFSLSHPAHNRALFCSIAQNASIFWTERGLSWWVDTCAKLAPINEYNTCRLLSVVQNYATFAPDLRELVRNALLTLQSKLSGTTCNWVKSRIEAYLRE